MNKFVIIVNALKDRGLRETEKLCHYIEARGGSCKCIVSVDAQEGVQKVLPERIPAGTECMLVLGGDGTLIRAARDTVSCGIPLLGINMGTLGYLCELEISSARGAIDAILCGEYMLEERMMLSGEQLMLRTGTPDDDRYTYKTGLPDSDRFKPIADTPGDDRFKPIADTLGAAQMADSVCHALNDIVIHRTGYLSLVSLVVYVNGQYLNTFKGDGMIISTPTGSTAYNMSAGGPIVDPKAQLLLLTPINPHTLMPKSIIIDAQDEIVVEVGSRRVQRDEMVEVSFDGDHGFSLPVGGCIKVSKAKECARILKFNKVSFLEILRKKIEASS